MLEKQSRLVKEKDFARVFKLGQSFYGKIFCLKILANELGVNRYGIVISAKVSKKSVKRNRLKRQFRAALKAYDKSLTVGFDLVIIVSPLALGQEYKFIKSELEKAWLKLKLFNHA